MPVLANLSYALYSAVAAFPTILKRSEIVEITSVEVSPIERALEEVRSRNTDLDLLYRRYISAQQETMTKDGTAFSRLNTTPLSMALNEAVDAGPSGGVALYKRAFFDPKYIAAHPDTLHHVEGLRSSIDEQVRTSACSLHVRVLVRSKRVLTGHAVRQLQSASSSTNACVHPTWSRSTRHWCSVS